MSINTILVSNTDYSINSTKQLLKSLEQVNVIQATKYVTDVINEVAKGLIRLVIIVDKPHDGLLSNLILHIMKTKPIPCLILLSTQNSIMTYKEYVDIPLVDTLEMNHNDHFFPKLLSIRINILNKLRVEKFKIPIDRMEKDLSDQIKTDCEESSSNHQNLKNQSRCAQQHIRVDDNYETEDAIIPDLLIDSVKENGDLLGKYDYSKIIVIGTSTGGPSVLTKILSRMPEEFPPILIVQHMPRSFVPQFADRLNYFCKLHVKVAEEGEIVKKNTVYIAQGGCHMELDKIGKQVKIKISDGPLVNFVKPAVDITLFAAARIYGPKVISVILTGMGSDGREGSRVVKKMGGTVIAQNEESSTVYGMNKAVIESNLADRIVDLSNINAVIAQNIALNTKGQM